MATIDTPAARMMEFIKKFHPEMYRRFVALRPDLVRGAFEKPINSLHGVDGMDGILDDIVDFGTKSLNLYQQQQTFKAQMQQAKATPVPVIQQSTASVPAFYPASRSGSGFGMLPVLGLVAAAVGAALFFLRGKKRR